MRLPRPGRAAAPPSPAGRVEPGPGQESVWDYPRPPRVEPSAAHVVVTHGGQVVWDTRRALRVLETSHPPTYYLPRADVAPGVLRRTDGGSLCEFKGLATYWDVVVDGPDGTATARRAGWEYLHPEAAYAVLAEHVALYPGRVDRVTVDGEEVRAQEGDFYGGWVTGAVVGPFKGAPGTWGW